MTRSPALRSALRWSVPVLAIALLAAFGSLLPAQSLEDPESGRTGTVPTCAPPPAGIWFVTRDCVMTGSRTAADDVRVWDGVTLRLAPGATLDIDFAQHHLWIGNGSRVIVGDGGAIR